MSDKTEEPTPKRLRKAREDGDSGVSRELGSGLGFLLGTALAAGALAALSESATTMVHAGFAAARAKTPEVSLDPSVVAKAVLLHVVPMLLCVGLTSAVAAIVQTGGVLATKRLSPDLGRLDPFSGLRGLFSTARLFSVVRALVLATLVLYVAASAIRGNVHSLANTTGNVAGAAKVAGVLALDVVRTAALLGLALAFVDLLVVRRSWKTKLRMSKEEVKREYKESEGDPEQKAARERAHHEVMSAAAVARVKDATVVVVNPTHLACALRYSEDEEDEAPVLLARGDGELAKKIVDAARAYGVPVLRDVPLARALHELAVGEPIPEALYEAVAEILREAFDELERS